MMPTGVQSVTSGILVIIKEKSSYSPQKWGLYFAYETED